MLDKQNTCEYICASGNFYEERKRTRNANGTDLIYDLDKMILLKRADESDMPHLIYTLQFYP